MITRSLLVSFIVSVLCLFVIGGPIANALFESPVSLPAPTATIAPASSPLAVPVLVTKVGWVVLGMVIAAGVVLTVSQRPHGS
jgi:hypothetical protein